jgi:uncharacterized protein YwqG
MILVGKGGETDVEPVHSKTFPITADFKLKLREKMNEHGLTPEHQKLIEEFIKANAVPCYHLEIAQDEEPTALDSSLGGIAYCPIGEELPKYTETLVSKMMADDWYDWVKNQTGKEIPLLVQINFKEVDLPGYPNKGIFQIFGGYDEDDYNGCLPFHCIARYYENVSDDYRKDIKPAYNGATGGCHKINLTRGWSMFSLSYCDFQEEFEKERPKEAAIMKKMRELTDDEYMDGCADVLDELFPRRSNIGGYAGATPQGQWLFPKDALLYLEEDLLNWGDGGAIYYYYEDITKLKKDDVIGADGDMR